MGSMPDSTTIGDRKAGYRLRDSIAEHAVGWLSHVISVKNITRPFWNRWRASLIGDETIMSFLKSIDSLDAWQTQSMLLVKREIARVKALGSIPLEQRLYELRRLSYLAHMGEWGCVEITEEKKELARMSRDLYIEAETLAHGDRYRRISIPWNGGKLWGNLHLPKDVPPPYPVVLILHGMDDSKEEHLMTELEAQKHGAAVCCYDGPGQGESFLLEGQLWTADFDRSASELLTHLAAEHDCNPELAGASGISWGGMWIYRLAANDSRFKAIYDLGGPINWWWQSLPYFLKSRFFQVLGATDEAQLQSLYDAFSIDSPAVLEKVTCAVRIVHGEKDPIVKLQDKEWLHDELRRLHPDSDITMRVCPNGDHCCTGEAADIRCDATNFFLRVLDSLRR